MKASNFQHISLLLYTIIYVFYLPKRILNIHFNQLILTVFLLFIIGSCSSSKKKDTLVHIESNNNYSTENNLIDCENNINENFNRSSNVHIKSITNSKNKDTYNQEKPPNTLLEIENQLNSPKKNQSENDSDISPFEHQKETFKPCEKTKKINIFGVTSIDNARKSLGQNYLRLSRSMDRVLSGNRLEFYDENRSFLRLETQATYFENGDFDQDISLRAKLDLPRTEHKFQVYFDSQFNDEQSIEERNATASSGESLARRGSSAGIEYGKQKEDSPWFTGVRIGAETQVPLRTFIRFKAGRWWDHNSVFSTKTQQDIWYLDGVGWGETSYLDFRINVSEHFYLLLENELEYADTPFPISYLHSFNVLHRLNEKNRIRYRIAAIGSNDEDNIIDKYFANIVYTYRLHEDWLFVSFIPEVIFRGQYQNDRDFAEDPQPVPTDWEPWEAEGAFTIKFDIFTN